MVPFGGFEDGLTGRSFLISERAPGGALFLCAGAVCHGKCRPEIDHRLPFEFFDCSVTIDFLPMWGHRIDPHDI